MKASLAAFALGPALLAGAEAVPADLELAVKVGGVIVTIAGFAYGTKHLADQARRTAEAADQKATACFRKLDTLQRDFHDEVARGAALRGEIKGELKAWTERLKAVGDGVHAARNELGNRITRIEDQIEAIREREVRDA